METKAAGWTLVLVGLIVVLLSLAADSLGVGEGTSVGYKQMTGAVIGLILAVVGARRALRS